MKYRSKKIKKKPKKYYFFGFDKISKPKNNQFEK
jgi:hypothetical protein